jgi:uncharacterized membrane protein (UPF0127 family)
MQFGALHDSEDGRVVVARVARTTGALERLRGLLGSPPPAEDSGLWITRCNSVHTALMRYPIDVVFFDGDLRVVAVVAALRPWRFAAALRARSTLELAAGRAAGLGLLPGRQLRFEAAG